MKVKKYFKSVVSLVLALALVIGMFSVISFAVREFARESTDFSIYDCLKPTGYNGFYYILHLSPKYVRVSDDITLTAVSSITDENPQKEVIPLENIKIEKRNVKSIESFVIYVKYTYPGYYIHISDNAFFDSERNGNVNSIRKYWGEHNFSFTDMFSYSIRTSPVTYKQGSVKTPELDQGDTISLTLNGSFANEYKVYLDDKFISSENTEPDVKFDSAGEHTLKVVFNDIVKRRGYF